MKDKKYCKVIDHCHYTREYRGAVHSICNLKYSVLKKMPIAFHSGSYDQRLVEEFKERFTSFGENAEKCITMTVPIEKEVTKIDKKMEKKLQKLYLTSCNLLIA